MKPRRGLRPALVAAAAAMMCLAAATPAWAESTIPLRQSNVKAGDFEEQNCGDERFAARPSDHDGWHFVLPGGSAAGSFVSLTLNFTDNDGNPVTVIIPDPSDPYPDAFYESAGRTNHAYLFTPAGWTLVDGEARITGDVMEGRKFNLSHTCAGKPGAGEPTPSPSDSNSPPVSPSDPASPSTSPSSSPAVPGDDEDGGALPVTGVAVGAISVLGVALIAGGAALMFLRRRNNVTFIS